jgi:hypothetical protein
MCVRISVRRDAPATIVLFAPVPNLASYCSFLNRDPLPQRDQQIFSLSQGARNWSALDDVWPDLTDQAVESAYVIRENIDPARTCAVIMKSARCTA